MNWLRGVDLNHRPLGYEPNELPGCSTPHFENNRGEKDGQIRGSSQSGDHRCHQLAIFGCWVFERTALDELRRPVHEYHVLSLLRRLTPGSVPDPVWITIPDRALCLPPAMPPPGSK